jgi:hypothetical protein
MATATAKPITEIPEVAQTARAQILQGVQQSHKFTLDAVQAIAKTTSSLPTPEMPAIPGLPGVPSTEDATKFIFDFGTELLNAQRDFALEVAKLFAIKA